MLHVNGARYHPYQFDREEELDGLVEEHHNDIFGDSSVYFGKKKISSLAGVCSIPDAYAIMFTQIPKWFVVEVELSSHRLYDHIVPQITKFANGLKNDSTRRQLLKFMDREIRQQPAVQKTITERFQEVYRFLSDVIYEEPTIVIVIDQRTEQLDEVVDSIKGTVKVLEFQTFERDGSPGVFAHTFEPIQGISAGAMMSEPIRGRTRTIEQTAHMPEGLSQVLDVYRLTRKGSSVRDAVVEIARQRGVAVQTVADKCARQLGLSMSEFKALVQDRQELTSRLKSRFQAFSSEIDSYVTE